ncbi:hypothetical protein GE061_020162 [Apolygus lucorum]|uniref:Uncharacterized protein n=1 Tax=Apolygus lucorum TaxID=248454 RepID=A0A6A4JAD1_APOLU|nr:hypothetical protein GE061_020162 [Apolygus lucorum]
MKDQRNMESSESQDEVDFGFPPLPVVDKDKHLQCYSSVLTRAENDVLSMEELDHLQPELEMLLSAAVLRQQNLQSQIDVLSHPQDDLSQDRPWMQKKRKLNDNRVSKSMKDLLKARDNASKMSSISSSENETDNSADAVPEATSPKSNTGKLALPKNDTSNKFWASIDSYCSNITEDNIKELEQLISCCDNDMAGVKIPPVGRHYTERWAEQELAQERNLNSGRHLSNSSDSDTVSLLKKASNMCHDRSPGPLVQRLVSALLEEPTRDSFPQKISDDSENSIFLGKIPLYHTTACFERRIRRELEAAGYLDSKNKDEDDEILVEIKKCEEELKAVASLNKEHLCRLLGQAKEEMERQKVRSIMREVDEKIISIYKKAVTPKLKKKQLREKKRRQAWKLLKEREALLSRLATL